MAGITGIFAPGKKKEVEKMLNKISHRGLKGKAILELKEATLGVVWPALHEPSLARWKKEKMVKDDRGTDHFALARVREKEPELGMPGFGYDNILSYDYDNLRYHLGNGLEVSNIYPFYYAQAFEDGLRLAGEKEIVNLIRCAWLGSQRFGVVVWSGDIPSTFDSLQKQLRAGLNMAMCGIPWWTTDIGGFYDGNPNDPAFQELIIRWFQFGVFCPIFRLHGFRLPYPPDSNKCEPYNLTGGPNEIWSFGEEAYDIIKNLLFLREKIKPYLMEQMKRAHEEGIPIMRPLFIDFPSDDEAYSAEDEYMFGPDLLVAPILYEGMRSRRVYLPEGAKWTSAYDGTVHEGGQWIESEAPLNVIPIFLKNEAKIPISF